LGVLTLAGPVDCETTVRASLVAIELIGSLLVRGQFRRNPAFGFLDFSDETRRRGPHVDAEVG
jgi:hypothetical protein